MKTSLLKILTATFVSILLILGALGCGGDRSPDDHVHGPDTHTHETPSALADTAGTYVDTTSIDLDHEHGPDTHTHEDVPAHE